jgi:hypothetical protein
MEELDNNVFIQKWFCHIDKSIDLYKEYYIYYVDGGKRRVVFTKESTDEEIKPQLLHFVNRDLEEKGWVKNEPEVKEYEHNPDDPYYQNEDLYIPNEINCGS